MCIVGLDLQFQESSIDAFGIEGLLIGAVTRSFEGPAVFRMLGAGDDCEQALVARQAAAVFGGAGSATIGAGDLAALRRSEGQ
jgi:hypothetical protein